MDQVLQRERHQSEQLRTPACFGVGFVSIPLNCNIFDANEAQVLNIRSIIFLGLSGLFLVGYACKKKTDVPEFQHAYFGLQKGRFVEYDVTQIRHDAALNVHDTNHYQLRTLIGDTVIDNAGRVARNFFRYVRTNSAASWTLQDVWTSIIDGSRAELVEENQRVIKLVFIPTDLKEWNPNAFNMLGDMTSYYKDLHMTKSVNGMTFDSTLVVEQENYKTLIDYRRKKEMYAKGVGLVSKYYKDLRITGFDTLSPTHGEELFYTVTNYGLE
jgi:hypothetical protein